MLLVPFILSAQTDPALLRFVHPDAKALISVDWKRVRQSHLGTMIRQKWVDGNSIPGVEFLNDIDRFVISSPGRNPAGTATEEAPLLIVRDAAGRLLEIPFVEAYLDSVDVEQKQVRMKLPEGLLEVNAPLTPEEKREQAQGARKKRP